MLYQPGTTALNGKPWWRGSVSPFIFVAKRVSGCIAFARGMLRK
jgi:hypothetical protein